jgi:molecular chaperone GrpE
LSDAGLARIDAIGTTFDPTEHEAVEHVILDTPTKEPGQVVVGVLRPGYRWNTTLLRPATVRVGEHAS